MDIVICTTARTDAEAKALLQRSTFRSAPEPRESLMAKKSMIERELKRQRLVAQFATKRAALKAAAADQAASVEDRFKATLKLAELPRNSSKVRLHNRCQLTGRPHAYYRKLKVSRIMLRELGSNGEIPGLVKSSW